MIKTVLIGFVFLTTITATAQTEQAAHAPGLVEVEIAFDQLNGVIQFSAPAESLLGFEHKPKTEKQKSLAQNVENAFKSQYDQMFQFEKNLKCQINLDKAGFEYTGSHADFVSNYKVVCKGDISKTKITIDLNKYKNVKTIRTTVISSGVQKATKSTGQIATVEIQ